MVSHIAGIYSMLILHHVIFISFHFIIIAISIFIGSSSASSSASSSVCPSAHQHTCAKKRGYSFSHEAVPSSLVNRLPRYSSGWLHCPTSQVSCLLPSAPAHCQPYFRPYSFCLKNINRGAKGLTGYSLFVSLLSHLHFYAFLFIKIAKTTTDLLQKSINRSYWIPLLRKSRITFEPTTNIISKKPQNV